MTIFSSDITVWDIRGNVVGRIDRYGNVTKSDGTLAGRVENPPFIEYHGIIVGYLKGQNVFYTPITHGGREFCVGSVVGHEIRERYDKQGHEKKIGEISQANPLAGAAALLLIFREP